MIEHLEQRVVFSADPIGSRVNEGLVTTLAWQGRQVEAVRDSWVMRMPQTNAATARSVADYRSNAPQVPAGWSVRDLGRGFYGVSAPGVSMAEVSAWATRSGTLAFQPNILHRKLADLPDEGPTEPPANPGFGSLWGLQNTGQVGAVNYAPGADPPAAGTPGSDIDVAGVWAEGVTGSRDIIIAVMDDGIDYTHADLQANMWTRPSNVPATQYGLHGWDSADDDGDIRSALLTDDHGTHVAGTIGATGNNGEGVTGVMQEVLLYGAKVFGDGAAGASTSDQVDALNRIIDLRVTYGQNIVAINASLGGYGFDPVRSAAIAEAGQAGILFVAAAGNGGADGRGDNNDVLPVYPAGERHPNVISVAASNRRDQLTVFSNWGQAVHIAAPGSGIWSTVPGDAYAEFPGTSMASPHVAGVAGLIASAYFAETGELPSVEDLRAAIIEGADVIATVPGVSGLTNATTRATINGNRRANALGSLEYLMGADASVRVVRPSGREGHTGTTAVEFSVRLAKPALREPVEVSYATVDGTAVAGEDYVAASGTLVFQPGEQFKTVTVQVIGDRDLEDDEAFTLDLTDVVNGRLGTQRRVEYRIVNDEPPLVTIRPAVALEGTGRRTNAVFEVSVTGDMTVPIMVSYATRDDAAQAGRDYVPTRGMLILQPGETTKTIAVKVIGDTVAEADEAFSLVATARNGTLDEQSLVVPGYIIDDDSRVISVSAVSPTVQGGSPAAFRVALERIGGFTGVFPTAPAGLELPPLTISAVVGSVSQSLVRGVPRAIGGTDYTTVSQTLTFTPSTLVQTVTVPTSPVDGPRAFLMRVVSAENARVGTETAGTVILGAADQADATQFTARPAGRASGRLSMAAWGGFGRRR